MKYFWIITSIIVLVFIQVGIFNNLGKWHPDLILLFVTVGVFRFSYKKLLLLSLISAFMLELFSSLSFGIIVLSLFFAVLLARFIKNNFLTQKGLLPVLIIALILPFSFHIAGYFLTNLYSYFGQLPSGLNSLSIRIWQLSLPLVISNVVIILFLYFLKPTLTVAREN